MRPRSALVRLTRGALAAGSLGLIACASTELPLPPHPDPSLLYRSARPSARDDSPRQVGLEAPRVVPTAAVTPATVAVPSMAGAVALPSPSAANLPVPSASSPVVEAPPPPPAPPSSPAAPPAVFGAPPPHCASVPPLLPNGAAPPAPPHTPLGEDVAVPDDRPAYVLPGAAGDPRVIIYLPGMCGDATAADYFRQSARAHGTLISVRGDTACENGRFKWRDGAAKIHARIRAAFASVNAQRGGDLSLDQALLFGYSQGADRAEKVAAMFPRDYPRVVLGGPPLKPSPLKLGRATRVVVFGGELETTDNMRAGFAALQGAGIASRWFTLDCAYHGYFGTNAETQVGELLDWVTQP